MITEDITWIMTLYWSRCLALQQLILISKIVSDHRVPLRFTEILLCESVSLSILLGLIMTKANLSGVLTNFYLLALPSYGDQDIYNILKS